MTTLTNTPSAILSRRLSIVALLIAAMLILATSGCSTTDGPQAQPSPQSPVEQAPLDEVTRAIVTDGPIHIYDGIHGDHVMTLDETTDFGTQRVFLVENDHTTWLQVRLPSRPNNQLGWIKAEHVTTEALDLQVYVDLESRQLTVNDGDQTILSTVVAIGSDTNQTPTGTFYVTDKLETPDPAGAYGPYALGLSGFSETLTEFAGGNGQIGLHGTNDPDSLGRNVSHGCIRVSNEVIVELAQLLPVGTPIHVV